MWGTGQREAHREVADPDAACNCSGMSGWRRNSRLWWKLLQGPLSIVLLSIFHFMWESLLKQIIGTITVLLWALEPHLLI